MHRRGRPRETLVEGVRLEQLWYVVGFAFAGVSFVFLTIGAAWLIYALMFVAFDIEVVFIYLWALVFKDPALMTGAFVSMLVFVVILLLGLAYAWRKGALTWR
jgi:NAD(P)H-quinone oxidoreductase subunit 3